MRTTARVLVAAVISVLAFGAAPAHAVTAKPTVQYAIPCCGGR